MCVCLFVCFFCLFVFFVVVFFFLFFFFFKKEAVFDMHQSINFFPKETVSVLIKRLCVYESTFSWISLDIVFLCLKKEAVFDMLQNTTFFQNKLYQF